MKPSPKTIVSFHFDEVVVPANPGAVNTPGHHKPLHMLPVAGSAGWSVQFDELPKLILRMTLADVATDRPSDAPRPLDATGVDGGPLPNLIPVIDRV